MKFSYNWLQSFFEKRLPKPEKLAELLTMHAFEVKEVKKSNRDWILDIDVLPNRVPDCGGHIGIAREIAAIMGLKIKDLRFKIKEGPKKKVRDFIEVKVKDKKACPRYSARVLAGVEVGPSPKWLEERLRVCGLQPINNIVDIANYVMLETGQPLHAFDFDKLDANIQINTNDTNQKTIFVRFAKKGEKITALDNKNYNLDEDVLVIADSRQLLAIAGIKGGRAAEINKRTKTIVLESANFEQHIIRRGSKKLNLRTDASLRFEHGLDPNLTEFAIERAAFLIQKLAKGKVAKGLLDVYPRKVLPKKIKLDIDYVKDLLGIEVSRTEIIKILKSLDLKVFRVSDFGLQDLVVEVPTIRRDIAIPEDLIEEVARILGFQEIPSIFPTASLIPPKRNLEIFWEREVKDILKSIGFSEFYNYSFVSQKDAKDFNYQAEELIEIENPISIEQKYLRPSLISNLLKNVQKNQKYFSDIRIFELGKIFRLSRAKIIEKRELTGLMIGDAFYQLKGVVDLLLRKLGISNIWFAEPSTHLMPHSASRSSAYDDYQPSPQESKISIWHPKKCAEIKVDQQEIGFLGEIRSEILKNLKIKERVTVFDFDFEKLQKLSSEETIYQPVSPYPAAVRDIAVLVPRKVKIVEVLNKINVTGGKLVRDVDLFDIYEGERIPQEKKNLAFHIIYQADDHTLSSEEIDKIHNKIVKALEENSLWEVRK